jgi:oxygen-dependent protoporphyrinogen oxidase
MNGMATELPSMVIGAGISGLSAAIALRERGLHPLVLEARAGPGGVVTTVESDGYLCEAGPNSFRLSRPESVEVLERYGILQQALDAAPQAKKRFLVREGKLVALPSSPASFFTAPIPSWRARLQLLGEIFVGRGSDPDETIAGFVRRRLGAEWLEEMVGPLVSGVYAGDPDRILVRHAWPKLYRMEQEKGGLLRGAFGRKKSRRIRSRMISWPGGLGALPKGLASALGGDVRYGHPVLSVKREASVYRVTAPGEIGRAHV